MGRNLAAFFALPVLVTNQVTSKYAPRGDALVSQHEATVVAALGNTWSHSVNTRLVVEFAAAERRLRIAKSPIAPPAAFFYRIDAGGFCVLAEDRDWANADPNAAAPITSRAAAMLAGDEEHVFSQGDLAQQGDDNDDDDAWLFEAELSLGSGEWA